MSMGLAKDSNGEGMKILNTLSDAADQMVTVPLPDGSTVQFEFFYRAGIQRWFLNVSHPLLTLVGFGITQGPNILRQWRNIIPFGMNVKAVDFIDPIQSTDFQSGRVVIRILNSSEVQAVEQIAMSPVSLVNA